MTDWGLTENAEADAAKPLCRLPCLALRFAVKRRAKSRLLQGDLRQIANPLTARHLQWPHQAWLRQASLITRLTGLTRPTRRREDIFKRAKRS